MAQSPDRRSAEGFSKTEVINFKESSLMKRMKATLSIPEKRGYNLTIDDLASSLIGGAVTVEIIEKEIEGSKEFEREGGLIARKGHLNSRKCIRRIKSNNELNPIFTQIAKEYSHDLVRFCPWVKTVMVAGSVASNGVCVDDDIDINLVVSDGSKYTSFFIALLIALKYSFRNPINSRNRYFGIIPKVICINVVWEESQTRPFIRQDEQMAFELFNSNVIFGHDHFNRIIIKNPWLKVYFPQIAEKNNSTVEYSKERKSPPKVLENLSRFGVSALFKIVEFSRGRRDRRRARMIEAERSKTPYGIFDDPRRELR